MQDSTAHNAGEAGMGGPVDGPTPVSDFGVKHDGDKYRFNGVHYDRLVKALAGDAARLGLHLVAGDGGVETPSDGERLIMSVLNISYTAGLYGHEGFACDRLADAVTYAYLRRHTHGFGPSW